MRPQSPLSKPRSRATASLRSRPESKPQVDRSTGSPEASQGASGRLDTAEGIALFTDGSAHYQDRSGGWAWVGLDASSGIERDSGYVEDTTVNQMELLAAIKGMEYVHDAYGPTGVLIYSDSEYVVKGATDRTRKRNKNREYWRQLDAAVESHHHVEFIHVKGHSDHLFNEMADELAGTARRAGLAAKENR